MVVINRSRIQIDPPNLIIISSYSTSAQVLATYVDRTPNSQKRCQEFCDSLETLCTQLKTDPILVIPDSDGTHKAKTIWEWLKENPRVHLLRFPEYTPHLNPVETVWRILKARLANYRFMGTGELIWAIQQHFRHGLGVEFELPIAA